MQNISLSDSCAISGGVRMYETYKITAPQIAGYKLVGFKEISPKWGLRQRPEGPGSYMDYEAHYEPIYEKDDVV